MLRLQSSRFSIHNPRQQSSSTRRKETTQMTFFTSCRFTNIQMEHYGSIFTRPERKISEKLSHENEANWHVWSLRNQFIGTVFQLWTVLGSRLTGGPHALANLLSRIRKNSTIQLNHFSQANSGVTSSFNAGTTVIICSYVLEVRYSLLDFAFRFTINSTLLWLSCQSSVFKRSCAILPIAPEF